MLWLHSGLVSHKEKTMPKCKHEADHPPQRPPDDFQQLHSRLTRIKVYTVEIAATVFFVALVIYVLIHELSGLFK